MWKNSLSSLSTTQKALIQRHLYSITIGFLAGTTVGTVGWGGAQIIIPSLTANYSSFAGLTQFAATGVSLTSLSLSTCSSGYKFYNDNQVDISTALAIGIPAVLSARYGTKLASKLSGDALSLFFNGFSIILIPTHFIIQERAKLKRRNQNQHQQSQQHDDTSTNNDGDEDDNNSSNINKSRDEESTSNDKPHNNIWIQHSLYGLISGVVNALMGVGGLPLTMSYLTESTDLHHHYIQGTSICATIPSIATSAFSRVGVIPIGVTSSVCVGAIIGGYTGANFALYLQEEQLRNLYMGSLAIFGSRSAIGAVRNIRNIILHK